ncbi:hypothetical protein ABZY20_04260 [Streptomyces sp. NPDC006624]|uniref:hypothetical protein n=1 Tax=Streptomyces sp. NPDC006624 TaxID=3154892 RepID=UPI0033B511D0
MGSEEHVCPRCGQPVETVVRRHKTLGTWVPRWVPGPCRNTECATYSAESAQGAATGEDTRPAAAAPAAEPPGEPERPPGESVAENS